MSPPLKKIVSLCMLWAGLHAAAAQAYQTAVLPTKLPDRNVPAGNAATASMGVAGRWIKAPIEMLEGMRGAYDSAAGIKVSFGIERAVYVDGSLVSSTSLNIADIGRMTGDQASQLSAAGEAVKLVQIGPGNFFNLADASQLTAATVIQNTLNNQHIAMVTTIDAATDGLQMLKGLNLGTALRDALSLPLKIH